MSQVSKSGNGGQVKISQLGSGMDTIKGKITNQEKRKIGVSATRKAGTIWINVSNMKAICTKGKTTTIKVVRGKTPGSSMARTEPMILATSLISSKDITRMTNNVLKDPLLVLMAFSMMEEITCATRAVATKLVRATREIGSQRKNFKVTGRKISLARKMLEAGRAQQTIDL